MSRKPITLKILGSCIGGVGVILGAVLMRKGMDSRTKGVLTRA